MRTYPGSWHCPKCPNSGKGPFPKASWRASTRLHSIIDRRVQNVGMYALPACAHPSMAGLARCLCVSKWGSSNNRLLLLLLLLLLLSADAYLLNSRAPWPLISVFWSCGSVATGLDKEGALQLLSPKGAPSDCALPPNRVQGVRMQMTCALRW